ncbi:MAG: iron ABC transporter permease [Oscillibacter sp.]|nr:iron ABC transporter permease [Oscillibacter sp.]
MPYNIGQPQREEDDAIERNDIHRDKTGTLRGCALLLALLAAAFILHVHTGSVKGTGELMSAVVWRIRLPRAAAACLLGGALSVSGFLLQTFFSNPIAGPFVLGISSGAKLTVALVMIAALDFGLSLSAAAMVLAAFAGSLLSMGLVLLLSRRVRRMSLLVVCGVMIGYLCSAATDFAVTFADDANIVNLHSWSLGSFAGIGWESIGLIAALTAAGVGLSFLLSKPMEAYQMGEAYARNLGVDLRRLRWELVLLSSLLSAVVTAFAGPVSFVGVAVPHLVRRLLKSTRPLLLIPACFLGGGAFCLLCDWIARTAFAPTEMNISSVTAFFGAPVVVGMMASRDGGGRQSG